MPLTPELAKRLGRMFQGGAKAWDQYKEAPTDKARDEALNKIVTDNEPFIRKAVEAMFARGLLSPLASTLELSVDDLMQAGRIAYTRALAKFDPSKGALPPYAKKWVINEVARTAASSSTIHKPANVGVKAKTLRKAEAIESQYGRQATPEEMGLTEAQYLRWKKEAIVVPLEAHAEPLDGARAGGNGPIDYLAVDSPSPEDLTTFRELGALVEQLPEPCQGVVKALYWDDMTLDGAAAHLRISVERVKGLRTIALGHLRAFMDQDPGSL